MNKHENTELAKLTEALLGDATKQGFIHDMRQHREDITKQVERLEKKIEQTRIEVSPIVSLFSHWKFISGLIIGLISFAGSVAYLVYHLLNIRNGG